MFLGLENNADLGFKAIYTEGGLTVGAGFYKNPENEHGTAHFRPDVTALGDITVPGTAEIFRANDDPVNQFNGSLAYVFGDDPNRTTTVGGTARIGQLYNTDTRDKGSHWASAAFVTQKWDQWAFILQAARYQYNPERPAGQPDDSIALSDGRLMPASGNVYSTRVSYTLPVRLGPFKTLTFFDDFDYLDSGSNDQLTSKNTSYNIGGMQFSSGNLNVWVTVQSGRNASVAFVGPDANDDKWHHSYNVITGIYFW